MKNLPVSVIILTYNEEVNIRFCLESVKQLTDEIFIVDSYSTDGTLAIVSEYTDKIYQNTWVHFAHQRNWALDNLPITYEWVLFLDADELLTEALQKEIGNTINNSNKNGYYIKRNNYFLGKWIKYGGNQSDYILRLVRKGYAHVIKKGAWEYFAVKGHLGYIESPILHKDQKSVTFWIDKHNQYASVESKELYKILEKGIIQNADSEEFIQEDSHIERKKRIWLREKIWIRLPFILRPFIYFMYRYVVRLGFLDGKEGFIYCFLQGLWYPFLVDVKYLELKKGLKIQDNI